MHIAKRFGRLSGCLFVALAGMTPGVPAQEETAAPDYSRGFESFYTLGLPDVKEAVYVRLDKQTARQNDIFSRQGNQGPDIGGVWMLKRLDEEEGEMLVGGINRLTVISNRRWQEEQEARMKEAMAMRTEGAAYIIHEDMQENRRLPGSWETADVAEDARRLVAFLEASETGGRHRPNPLQNNSGTLFLLAVHLHRSGAAADANRAAHLLFDKAGGQQAVIESALSMLADTQYGEVYRTFITSRDWQALRTGIDTLAARFARGWQRRDAVLKAAAMVEVRLAGAPPPLQDEGLGEEDQALAAELAAVDTVPRHAARALQSYSQELWVLPGTQTARGRSPSAAPAETTVLDRIKARGMQSIPLLIALLEDAYPTVFDNPGGDVNSFIQNSFYFTSSSPSSPQALARMAAQRTVHYYASLPRPLTRGEIAATLLQQVVPTSRQSRFRMGDGDNRSEAIRTAATAWYDANKGKTGIELALGYLDADSDGASFSQNAVLMYLAREGGTAELAIVEQKLLEAEPMQGSSMAMQYAQMRGDDARPFVEKYLARLKAPAVAEKPSATDDNEAALFVHRSGTSGGNEQWMKRMIKQFEALLVNANLGDLLTSLISGEKTLADVAPSLHRAIAKETPTQAVGLLLDAACRTKDVTTAMSLIGMVQTIPYSRRQPMAPGGMSAAQPETVVMPSPAEHRDLWTKLLADTRTSADGESAMVGFAEQYSIATVAAYAIEALGVSGAESAMRHHSARMENHMILGERLVPLQIQRATLLVEGKDASALPPLPDAGNVSKEARLALAETLIATESTTALRKALDALGMDELLAVLQDVDGNNRLRERLAPLANTITAVKVEIGDETIKARLEALKGTLFSRTTGEQMLEAVRQLSPGGKPATEAFAQRGTGFKGVTIILRNQGTRKPGGMHYYMGGAFAGQRTAGINGLLHGQGAFANGRWKVEAEKTAPAAEAGGDNAQASVAESRKQQLLAMMTASGKDLPPEAIAMLEKMSDEDLEGMDFDDENGMDEGEHKQFWETLDRVCGEKSDLTFPVMLTFVTTTPLPVGKGDDHDDGKGFIMQGDFIDDDIF